MYLLDTNIVSLLDPRRASRAAALIDWIDRNGADLYLSVITVTEIETGTLKLRREAKTHRADQLARMLTKIMGVFADRLLPMDAQVALAVARIAEAIRPAVIELEDLIIAATAETHDLTVLTRNTRHIAPTGVRVIDPLETLPPDIA